MPSERAAARLHTPTYTPTALSRPRDSHCATCHLHPRTGGLGFLSFEAISYAPVWVAATHGMHISSQNAQRKPRARPASPAVRVGTRGLVCECLTPRSLEFIEILGACARQVWDSSVVWVVPSNVLSMCAPIRHQNRTRKASKEPEWSSKTRDLTRAAVGQ